MPIFQLLWGNFNYYPGFLPVTKYIFHNAGGYSDLDAAASNAWAGNGLLDREVFV